jgi:hypothetical protein
MTLPVSPNAISMSQMNTEISRSSSAQLALSDATLRGLISKGAGVQFSFSELHGKSFETINISNATILHLAHTPANASAAYRLDNAGNIIRFNGATPTDMGDWITPQVNMANYESRATLNSGTTPSGTLNTWQALTSNRTWTLSRSTVGTSSCSITVEIRRAVDGVVMDSAIISLTAEKD